MRDAAWQKDYPEQPSPDELAVAQNNSLAMMSRLIPSGSDVLEFGCASGYFSHLLTRRGCRVTGIEINVQAAEQARRYCQDVLVTDLDVASPDEWLGGRRFDVATFGDVLEHLRDPWQLLERVRDFLKPDGRVVASIPNIAHGAVRLALLEGRFEYQPLGVLDNTHLRHFTAASVGELFARAGFYIEVFERTVVSYRDPCPLVPAFDRTRVSRATWRQLDADPEANTLQFIVQARPGVRPAGQPVLPPAGSVPAARNRFLRWLTG